MSKPPQIGNTIAPLSKSLPSGASFRRYWDAELAARTSVNRRVLVTPIDGWGYLESVDGELAPPFVLEKVESGVFEDSGLSGWYGRVLQPDHKYDGMVVTMTPRHVEETPIVVLTVIDGDRLIFSGMAETAGLSRNWK